MLFRFEHRSQPLLSHTKFLRRISRSALLGLVFLVVSLGIGMAGYHYTEDLSILDSFTNASMILSGMGPLTSPTTVAGKLFAGSYALYSGLAVLAAAGVMFAPFVHRLLHVVHAEQRDRDDD